MASGRKGVPRGDRLHYTPKQKPAQVLLAFVNRCRATGWTVARIAQELLGVSRRTLHRWLAEERRVPERVTNTVRCVTSISATGVKLELEAGGRLHAPLS